MRINRRILSFYTWKRGRPKLITCPKASYFYFCAAHYRIMCIQNIICLRLCGTVHGYSVEQLTPKMRVKTMVMVNKSASICGNNGHGQGYGFLCGFHLLLVGACELLDSLRCWCLTLLLRKKHVTAVLWSFVRISVELYVEKSVGCVKRHRGASCEFYHPIYRGQTLIIFFDNFWFILMISSAFKIWDFNSWGDWLPCAIIFMLRVAKA